MKEHQTERWEHIDTCGSPDILYEAGEKYPAGTSFHYALHAETVVPGAVTLLLAAIADLIF